MLWAMYTFNTPIPLESYNQDMYILSTGAAELKTNLRGIWKVCLVRSRICSTPVFSLRFPFLLVESAELKAMVKNFTTGLVFKLWGL